MLLIAATLLAGLAGLLIILVSMVVRPAWAAQELSPPLKLPWEDGQEWLTGVAGFHGAKDALDFFPPDTPLSLDVKCEGAPGWVPQESEYWVVAAAAGTVTKASDSTVLIDHGNGWVTGYYHIHSFQVQPGDTVPPKWALGHPSTYGDCTTGPHVHFWAEGPNGQTLRDVRISGRDATDIGINEKISETGNVPPATNPTPTPTPMPTPLPTSTAAPTPTPTPTSTPAPSPMPPLVPTRRAPAPTPTPVGAAKGDVDCDGDVDAVDSLKILQSIADLSVNQTEPCPGIGSEGNSVFGDVDCDGDVDAVDSLKILRHIAALPNDLPRECAPIGA